MNKLSYRDCLLNNLNYNDFNKLHINTFYSNYVDFPLIQTAPPNPTIDHPKPIYLIHTPNPPNLPHPSDSSYPSLYQSSLQLPLQLQLPLRTGILSADSVGYVPLCKYDNIIPIKSDDTPILQTDGILLCKSDNAVRKYEILDSELNKIRALSSFKNILVENIMRYLRSHKLYNNRKLEYIRTQMYNHFPNWFFNLNNQGKIVNFVPTDYLEVQENLDYILQEHHLEKRTDFDQKLLLFNNTYIRDKFVTLDIVKNENANLVMYELKTNNGIWKLLNITKKQDQNLKERYTGPPELYTQYVAIMLLRYKFLGGINNHLSIPPTVYKYLGINMELFGSPLNVTEKEYASPFYDIERFFGSQGSFNQISLKNNRSYATNPPYDVRVVFQMASWLTKELERPELNNVVIYLTLPLWRLDFPGYKLLRESKWFRDESELKREEYPFLHYFKGKLIAASDTYLMIMSTKPTIKYNCQNIKNNWPGIKHNFFPNSLYPE